MLAIVTSPSEVTWRVNLTERCPVNQLRRRANAAYRQTRPVGPKSADNSNYRNILWRPAGRCHACRSPRHNRDADDEITLGKPGCQHLVERYRSRVSEIHGCFVNEERSHQHALAIGGTDTATNSCETS